jgi:hypothetical protein
MATKDFRQELAENARKIVAAGKGILAADESTGKLKFYELLPSFNRIFVRFYAICIIRIAEKILKSLIIMLNFFN